jgi:vacuolar-type H+-ATPase subunit H
VTRADTLLKVKEAEAKAAQIVKDAQEKQKVIVANARRDALGRIRDGEAKMKEEREKAIGAEKVKLDAARKEQMAKGNAEANKALTTSDSKIFAIKSYLKESFEKSL